MTQIIKNLEAEVLNLRQDFLTSHTIQQDILNEIKRINQHQTNASTTSADTIVSLKLICNATVMINMTMPLNVK